MADLVGFIVVIVVLIAAIAVFLQFIPIGLLITAQVAGVPDVDINSLVRMRILKVRQERVVLPLIASVKAGVPLTLNQLETHYLAGGHVDLVVQALIAADRASLPLSFEKAAALDLAGDDPLAAVKAAHAGERILDE
ncbi:MAG TPA: flotillin-like FloA family protein [Capsulimonadaceae bacterium]|nr:flotillin-like FloA family protein [Capsulimonadaceae bacterium]